MAAVPAAASAARPCLLLLLFLFFLFFAFSLAQPAVPLQAGEPELGYVEGRITATEGNTAFVRLHNGQVVEADLGLGLGLSDELGGPDLPSFEVGQRVELYYAPGPDGDRQYAVSDWVRRPALIWLLALFFLVSVGIARLKGLRAFVATSASLAIAIGFVVPSILAGWNPILISLLGSGGILLLAIYFVHGLNWSTTAALLGTFIAVVLTMLLGLLFTDLAHLTGFGSEEAMMINIAAGQVNLRGLLLAGLLIGALGALTDITIVQASVVRELAHVNPSFGVAELYRRGMNVGLDHIGSLVDTLVLAYTGAALPLLVLLSLNNLSFARALNLELVAAEVVHTLVGAIGLIVAVPVTTFIAALMFRGDTLPMREGELEHAHHH